MKPRLTINWQLVNDMVVGVTFLATMPLLYWMAEMIADFVADVLINHGW